MSVCANTSCIATNFFTGTELGRRKINKIKPRRRDNETIQSGDAADGARRGTSPRRAARELINAETHSADMWFGFERVETIIRSVDPPSRCEDDC